MTKCTAFPLSFGILPVGWAVRVKSRFALYSASGAVDARARVREAVLLPVFRAPFVVAVRPARVVLVTEPLLVARFSALLARVEVFRPVARFVPPRGPVRLVAMRAIFAKSMPWGRPAVPSRLPDGTMVLSGDRLGPSRVRRGTDVLPHTSRRGSEEAELWSGSPVHRVPLSSSRAG